jgi:hypothetical protein
VWLDFERRHEWVEKIFKERLGEKFPNVMQRIKLKVQGNEQMTTARNTKKAVPRHLISKLL